MAQITELQVYALPGGLHSFVAKAALVGTYPGGGTTVPIGVGGGSAAATGIGGGSVAAGNIGGGTVVPRES